MTKNTEKQQQDSEARRLALTPDRSFIVQAPAGSGKTELLIQRYLTLLATVDSPEEVIAVTFTRKAAAEMQQRILAALTAVVTEEVPESEHALQTYQLATAVMDRNQQYDWHIIENPGRLKIQTIDSLCAYLTRQMPFLSQHGGTVKTVDDTRALYEEAAINSLGAILSDGFYSDAFQQLLLHLDNNLPRLKSLLQYMLSKRDQWTRYIYAADNKEELQQSIAILVEERLQQLVVAFPQDCIGDLLTLLNYATKQLASSDQANKLVTCQGIQELPGHKVDELSIWQDIANFLLTQSGNWRAQVNKNQGFPSPKDNKAEAELRTEKKDEMKVLLQRLHEEHRLESLLDEVRLLPEPEYNDADWLIVDALCQLLKIAAAQLNMLFADKAESDFISISEAAISALGTPEQPTDLALYLDYQIKHILIDEFQDISVNQFTLIERITAGWQADDGHTLFIVGDPMQSIYGFREAEVGQYISTFHGERLGDIQLTALQLSRNFRSQASIVDWVNQSFIKVLPERDDVTTGAVKFSESVSHTSEQAGEVKLHAFFSEQQEAEGQVTASIINTIKVEHPEDSVALLVRNRSHLYEILPLLREAQVPYQAIEIDSLGEQQYIQDLLALTKAYLYPADRVAWLSVLRAPWCGLKLDELFAITNINLADSIWQNCQNALLSDSLDTDAKQRLVNFVNVFSVSLLNRQRYSLRHSIETIWCSLAGPATLTNHIQLENVEAFFKLIENLDNAGRIDDISILERKIAELYALPDANSQNNPVQVMTIHKAKGLEFDHVVLPQLGRAPRPRQAALLMWMLHPDQSGYGHLLLSPIGRTGAKPGKLYAYLATKEKLRTRNEAARLLYVATTRARKSLNLLGQAKLVETPEAEKSCKPQSGSLLAHLWPAVEEEFIAKACQQQQDITELDTHITTKSISRLPADWCMPDIGGQVTTISKLNDHPPLNTELEIHFDWAGETIKHVGTVVHMCLAQVGTEPESELIRGAGLDEYINNRLLQLGVKASEIKQACELVYTALENMQVDERGRWLFSTEHTQARNEYALTGIISGRVMNVIMDRTFIDSEGTRWIIDYKISRHEGEDVDNFLDHELDRYKNKMELYGRIMAGMEKRPTMLGLYFPLLKGWRSWEFNVIPG